MRPDPKGRRQGRSTHGRTRCLAPVVPFCTARDRPRQCTVSGAESSASAVIHQQRNPKRRFGEVQPRKLDSVMVFLSKVETAFTVPTRGCVVVPFALTNPDLRVKAGDAVQLRGPNGCLDVHITAIEWLTRRDNGCHFGFLLSGNLDCTQIKPGAEIWVEDSR